MFCKDCECSDCIYLNDCECGECDYEHQHSNGCPDFVDIKQAQEIYEKYSEIVELMDGVIMNPPPYCRPYKYTKKQKVYDTMYAIQRIIGKIRFANEEKEIEK